MFERKVHWRRGAEWFVLIVGMTVPLFEGLAQNRRAGGETRAAIVLDSNRMAAKEGLLAQVARSSDATAERPNIILIVADDLGYADTGVYGSTSIPTPHIDSLARDGVRFTDAYVTAGTCSPSRAGMLSGRYQQRFGFEFNTAGAAITHRLGRGLEPSAITLADMLQRGGYRTGMFGKWHLGTREYFHPLKRGFDEFYGFLAGAHGYFKPSKAQPIQSTVMRGHQPLKEEEYLTDAIARETVQFIKRQDDRPFFAYVPFNAVHTPLEASEKYLSRFSHVKNRKQRLYNAMTSALDDAVGRILTALRDEDVEEKTLVVFLSDNGGPIYTGVQSNAPLRLGKLFLFEGGIRVPMLVRWPGRFGGGEIFRGVTSSLDLFPTFCDAARVSIPQAIELDGVSLIPYLDGEKQGTPHERLFWSNGPNVAVRMGHWKMVKASKKTWLFDLKNDIGEQHDLANQRPETLRTMESALESWRSEMPDPAWPSKPNRRKVPVDGALYEINI